VLVPLAAAASGTLQPLFVVWLGPALIAFLVLAFDFLPHWPYDTAERWFDTRIYPGRFLNAPARPELPLDPPPLDHDPLVPLSRGVRADRRGPGRERLPDGCRVAPLPDGVAPLPVEARVR
jgi:hypothetical protein